MSSGSSSLGQPSAGPVAVTTFNPQLFLQSEGSTTPDELRLLNYKIKQLSASQKYQLLREKLPLLDQMVAKLREYEKRFDSYRNGNFSKQVSKLLFLKQFEFDFRFIYQFFVERTIIDEVNIAYKALRSSLKRPSAPPPDVCFAWRDVRRVERLILSRVDEWRHDCIDLIRSLRREQESFSRRNNVNAKVDAADFEYALGYRGSKREYEECIAEAIYPTGSEQWLKNKMDLGATGLCEEIWERSGPDDSRGGSSGAVLTSDSDTSSDSESVSEGYRKLQSGKRWAAARKLRKKPQKQAASCRRYGGDLHDFIVFNDGSDDDEDAQSQFQVPFEAEWDDVFDDLWLLRQPQSSCYDVLQDEAPDRCTSDDDSREDINGIRNEHGNTASVTGLDFFTDDRENSHHSFENESRGRQRALVSARDRFANIKQYPLLDSTKAPDLERVPIQLSVNVEITQSKLSSALSVFLEVVCERHIRTRDYRCGQFLKLNDDFVPSALDLKRNNDALNERSQFTRLVTSAILRLRAILIESCKLGGHVGLVKEASRVGNIVESCVCTVEYVEDFVRVCEKYLPSGECLADLRRPDCVQFYITQRKIVWYSHLLVWARRHNYTVDKLDVLHRAWGNLRTALVDTLLSTSFKKELIKFCSESFSVNISRPNYLTRFKNSLVGSLIQLYVLYTELGVEKCWTYINKHLSKQHQKANIPIDDFWILLIVHSFALLVSCNSESDSTIANHWSCLNWCCQVEIEEGQRRVSMERWKCLPKIWDDPHVGLDFLVKLSRSILPPCNKKIQHNEGIIPHLRETSQTIQTNPSLLPRPLLATTEETLKRKNQKDALLQSFNSAVLSLLHPCDDTAYEKKMVTIRSLFLHLNICINENMTYDYAAIIESEKTISFLSSSFIQFLANSLRFAATDRQNVIRKRILSKLKLSSFTAILEETNKDDKYRSFSLRTMLLIELIRFVEVEFSNGFLVECFNKSYSWFDFLLCPNRLLEFPDGRTMDTQTGPLTSSSTQLWFTTLGLLLPSFSSNFPSLSGSDTPKTRNLLYENFYLKFVKVWCDHIIRLKGYNQGQWEPAIINLGMKLTLNISLARSLQREDEGPTPFSAQDFKMILSDLDSCANLALSTNYNTKSFLYSLGGCHVKCGFHIFYIISCLFLKYVYRMESAADLATSTNTSEIIIEFKSWATRSFTTIIEILSNCLAKLRGSKPTTLAKNPYWDGAVSVTTSLSQLCLGFLLLKNHSLFNQDDDQFASSVKFDCNSKAVGNVDIVRHSVAFFDRLRSDFEKRLIFLGSSHDLSNGPVEVWLSCCFWTPFLDSMATERVRATQSDGDWSSTNCHITKLVDESIDSVLSFCWIGCLLLRNLEELEVSMKMSTFLNCLTNLSGRKGSTTCTQQLPQSYPVLSFLSLFYDTFTVLSTTPFTKKNALLVVTKFLYGLIALVDHNNPVNAGCVYTIQQRQCDEYLLKLGLAMNKYISCMNLVTSTIGDEKRKYISFQRDEMCAIIAAILIPYLKNHMNHSSFVQYTTANYITSFKTCGLGQKVLFFRSISYIHFSNEGAAYFWNEFWKSVLESELKERAFRQTAKEIPSAPSGDRDESADMCVEVALALTVRSEFLSKQSSKSDFDGWPRRFTQSLRNIFNNSNTRRLFRIRHASNLRYNTMDDFVENFREYLITSDPCWLITGSENDKSLCIRLHFFAHILELVSSKLFYYNLAASDLVSSPSTLSLDVVPLTLKEVQFGVLSAFLCAVCLIRIICCESHKSEGMPFKSNTVHLAVEEYVRFIASFGQYLLHYWDNKGAANQQPINCGDVASINSESKISCKMQKCFFVTMDSLLQVVNSMRSGPTDYDRLSGDIRNIITAIADFVPTMSSEDLCCDCPWHISASEGDMTRAVNRNIGKINLSVDKLNVRRDSMFLNIFPNKQVSIDQNVPFYPSLSYFSKLLCNRR